MKRALAALTLCLGLIGGAAGPASAAGATAQRETDQWDYCYINYMGTHCSEGQLAEKVISKDAGTYLFHQKQEGSNTETIHTSRRGVPLDPVRTFTSQYQSSSMLKFRDGELTHSRSKLTGVNDNCTYEIRSHVVHGRVIHDDRTVSCS